MLKEKQQSFDAEANFKNGIVADEKRLNLPQFSERSQFKDVTLWRDNLDRARNERLKIRQEKTRQRRAQKKISAFMRLADSPSPAS